MRSLPGDPVPRVGASPLVHSFPRARNVSETPGSLPYTRGASFSQVTVRHEEMTVSHPMSFFCY